jgi:hypothetical protein
LPKYTFERHGGNNSAWTTDHSLLDEETLDEYLRVYRARTEWLTARFPDSVAAWRYFEWSFWISMLEKVVRLGLVDCNAIADTLRRGLAQHRDEFVGSPYLLDFEREWLEKYVRTA